MFKSAIVLGCALFSALLAGTGIMALDNRMHDRPADDAASASVMMSPAALQTVSAEGHVTAIPKASDGHFWANAVVNQRAIHFLVDTGATQVVLTPADAQRLGYTAANLNYDQKVITANGQTFAALVTLSTVGVGQSEVHNVEALVVKEGLNTSLLGMSYLGKLSRFEATPSSLILHP